MFNIYRVYQHCKMYLAVTVNYYNVFINPPFCFYLVNCGDFISVSRVSELLCKQWVNP